MSTKIEVAFGREQLPLALPDGAEAHVIRKRQLPKLPDPGAAIRAVLDRPIGAQPLKALAAGKQSACILICDITRPVPNHLFLRPMIEDLLDAGIPASGITILVATGLHRPNLGAELEELVGDPWVMKTVAVVNHDARDDSAHVDLGHTAGRRTPVRLDPVSYTHLTLPTIYSV